ncbi:hypothetical protein EIC56_17020 [Escherichia coli]|nr:hypothetical protein [Escherichia coli]
MVVNATCILLTLRYDGKYVCGNIFNNSPARCIFLFLFIPKYKNPRKYAVIYAKNILFSFKSPFSAIKNHQTVIFLARR